MLSAPAVEDNERAAFVFIASHVREHQPNVGGLRCSNHASGMLVLLARKPAWNHASAQCCTGDQDLTPVTATFHPQQDEQQSGHEHGGQGY